MTQTVKLVANSTFQKIADGPTSLVLNPITGVMDLVIKVGATVPAANFANTFTLKSGVVDGSITAIDIAVGSSAFIRGISGGNPVVSYMINNTTDDTSAQNPGYAFDVNVVPTVTNGAYSAGDIIGGLMTFPVSNLNDQKVILTGVQVSIKSAVNPNLTLILFNADPTATTKTDNAVYSLAAADTFKIIKAIPVSTLYDNGTPNVYSNDDISIVLTPVSGTKNVFGLLVDSFGVTLTSTSDIQVKLRGIGA